MFVKGLCTTLITLAIVIGAGGLEFNLADNLFTVESPKTAHAMDVSPPCTPPARSGGSGGSRNIDFDYIEAIEKTAAMVWDEKAQRLAELEGLNIVNVTWEDTGRYYNSSVGPNISDVTIQVQHWNPDTCSYRLTLMPVIRYPNFSDLTADIPLDKFYLLVGNEDDDELYRISLKEYLGDFRSYLSQPNSWDGQGKLAAG